MCLLTRNAQLLILIFAEVLGLYGLIVALIMNTKADGVSVVRTLYNHYQPSKLTPVAVRLMAERKVTM